MHAPPELQVHLRVKVTDSTTYGQIREAISGYMKASRGWNMVANTKLHGVGGVTPMEVDQIRASGKPTRPCRHCGGMHWDDDCFKAKGGKFGGKSGGKNFTKGGGKSNVSSSSKGGKSSASTASGAKEDRECFHCGKKGHLKKD